MSGVPDPFARLVRALTPWLDQAVIVGGWAHQLYRLHPAAQALPYPPLMTVDVDVAVPLQLPVAVPLQLPETQRDLRERLLAEGFTEEFLGHDHPPATHYRLGAERGGFYAEFLTPLTGSSQDRRQRRKTTVTVAGVTTQRLRHIDLLLIQPWLVSYRIDGESIPVPIANPISFLVQKILIHNRRGRQDRAKDLLYLHDTLEVFAARLSELRSLWQERIRPSVALTQVHIVARAADALFAGVTDDIRRASAMAIGRPLTPTALREAARYGLQRLFG